jgi:hypothetical protein
MPNQPIETLTPTQQAVVRSSILAVASDTTVVSGSVAINNIIALTQAQYDAIPVPDPNTFYQITDADDTANFYFAVITEATASRVLALTDAHKYIRCTNGSAVGVTVPPQTDVAWKDNTEIIIEQAGDGQVTVGAGSGVTLRTSQTLKTAAKYAAISVKRVASDEWVVGGEREVV